MLAALKDVQDPELPVSIVDLGMVRSVSWLPDASRTVHVSLVSTFLGCPAQMFIENDVRDVLMTTGVDRVMVIWETMPEWSPDDVSDDGRVALAAIGVVVPTDSAPRCPYCGADRVSILAPVGATLCRRLAHCEACGSSVEILRGPRDHWSASTVSVGQPNIRRKAGQVG